MDFYAEARRHWPHLDVPRGDFEAFLAERGLLDTAGAPLESLYLACACALGNPRAIEELEQRWFPDLDRVLAHLGGGPTLSREVKQVVMERLFTASPGERPRIHAYTGTGDLRGWLKVTVVRTAVSLLRKVKREVPLEEALVDERRADSDPELALLKGTYRAEFEHAFRAAVATLDPRDRNVLRYQVLEGLSIDEVAALYGVHRATIARWAQSAKDQLVTETKRELRRRLQVDASEIDSIIRLIQSRLDISLGGLLGDPTAKK